VIIYSIAFLILILLRVLSLRLVSSDNFNKEGIIMNKKMVITGISSMLETSWAIGVGIIAGKLLT
jgi:hypothetical protein